MKKDVIVIGAGLAGLLTAFYLKAEGKDVLVLEAKTVASGQTGRTTAKITSQHDIKYSRLLKTVGRNKAEMYALSNEAAIKEYEKLIMSHNIDCDFERVSAHMYSITDKKQLMDEVKAATSLGIDAYFTDKTELPFEVAGAACFCNQAMFSPLKFVNYVASELEIRENTKVIKIKGKEIITDNGNFTADKIVVATHYPIINFPGFYFLRQHQERSYVLELTSCPPIKDMYYGVDKGGLSFRQAGEALLLGGGAHRTGKVQKTGSFCFLRKKAKELFPDSKEVSAWAAQDCMPHDGIPFIGKYTIFRDDMYVITGFQKWGMTSSIIAARIITDAICGRDNPYSKLYSPQRINVVAGMGKFLMDVLVSTKGLFCGWLGKKEKRCKHLGCRLEWNQEENSYDCPCHGSRYDENGNILDNPTIRRIDI